MPENGFHVNSELLVVAWLLKPHAMAVGMHPLVPSHGIAGIHFLSACAACEQRERQNEESGPSFHFDRNSSRRTRPS